MTSPRYRRIATHLEACLERHGDTHLGHDWPNAQDTLTRHRVMLELLRAGDPGQPVRVLDLGCGTAQLYDYILREGIPDIVYSGLDISPRFIEVARQKHPDIDFWCADLLTDEIDLPEFDYVVINGVFTAKFDLGFDEMLAFFSALVSRAWEHARVGVAFNVMSKHVDWEREDLFHLPFDQLAAWVITSLSRNFTFRADYGLYEYTTYVYR